MVGIGADGGHFAVRLGHELLEHIVERFLLRRGRLLPVRLRLTLLEAAARALGLLPRGRRQGALDGKIDLSGVQSDDHDLDSLALGQILVQIAHIGVRDLGNVDKSGRVCVQRDERAEFGQALDSSFNNFSNLQLHLSILVPHFV